MSFKVEVGPPQISIHHGQTVLITVVIALRQKSPALMSLAFDDTNSSQIAPSIFRHRQRYSGPSSSNVG